MAHNDAIAATTSWVMRIAGLTMQAADLQKTMTERVWHWWETLSRVTLPQNLMEAAEKMDVLLLKSIILALFEDGIAPLNY